jgi:hypothetical protein
MNWPHHEDSHLCMQGMHPRDFMQLVSRLLSKIHYSKTRRPAHGFFSDLIS